VVVDTSGSIDNDLLNSFFSEINGIHKTLRPTKLRVMYCDAKVHEPVDEFGPDDDIVPAPKGYGGTAFGPAFQWINDNNVTPQCLVYLTDLYGDFPPAAPHYPVLWACWSKETEAPFGEVINVD
jgi:predicted metal-dependent peptidase